MQNMKPVWIFLIVAVIMLLFMKNKEGETFLDTIKDTIEVFTTNPLLLVLIGLVIFLFWQQSQEKKKLTAA